MSSCIETSNSLARLVFMVHSHRSTERPKPGPLRGGNRVLVLDLYQIKGGKLCLYLLLDLDDEVCKCDELLT